MRPRAGTGQLPSLAGLRLPSTAEADLLSRTREQWIEQHSISVRLDWWNAALRERDLPGYPVRACRDGVLVAAGDAQLSRDLLFQLATEVVEHPSEESALRLLWHTLAWGAGRSARNMKRRLDVLVQEEDAGQVLLEAASLARTGPGEAFELLCPGQTMRFTWLGPAFFTKFLYFAGAGDPAHPCIILDARVASALRYRCGWESLHPRGPWPPVTYQRFCDLMTRWAEELSDAKRRVAADEIERWLFDQGAPATLRQPTTNGTA